jgi:hypothetical protein
MSGHEHHHHKEGPIDDRERLMIVLKHLIEHNDGHVEDHKRWVEMAKKNGLDKVAELLEEANGYEEKTGNALRQALVLLKD